MNKTFSVNGMACKHCAAKVENAINALNGVESAKVNLEAKNVEVSFSEGAVSDADIKNAVNGAGYEFVG